jgi:hypothetical protein
VSLTPPKILFKAKYKNTFIKFVPERFEPTEQGFAESRVEIPVENDDEAVQSAKADVDRSGKAQRQRCPGIDFTKLLFGRNIFGQKFYT